MYMAPVPSFDIFSILLWSVVSTHPTSRDTSWFSRIRQKALLLITFPVDIVTNHSNYYVQSKH